MHIDRPENNVRIIEKGWGMRDEFLFNEATLGYSNKFIRNNLGNSEIPETARRTFFFHRCLVKIQTTSTQVQPIPPFLSTPSQIPPPFLTTTSKSRPNTQRSDQYCLFPQPKNSQSRTIFNHALQVTSNRAKKGVQTKRSTEEGR